MLVCHRHPAQCFTYCSVVTYYGYCIILLFVKLYCLDIKNIFSFAFPGPFSKSPIPPKHKPDHITVLNTLRRNLDMFMLVTRHWKLFIVLGTLSTEAELSAKFQFYKWNVSHGPRLRSTLQGKSLNSKILPFCHIQSCKNPLNWNGDVPQTGNGFLGCTCSLKLKKKKLE